MRKFLILVVMLLAAGPALARDWSATRFDAKRLTTDEVRVLQASMVLAGLYAGAVDGLWGTASQTALTGFATSAYGTAKPTFGQIAPLVTAFEQERRSNGWRMVYYETPDRSFALPSTLVSDLSGPNGLTWAAEDASLSISFAFAGDSETRGIHGTLQSIDSPGLAPFHSESPGQIITSVTLSDGSTAYLRSDSIAGGFTTLMLTAQPGQLDRMALIALSFAAGQTPDLALPESGILASLDGAAAVAAPVPRPKAIDLNPKDASSTGTGFYISDGFMVTAAHVANDCKAMSLADGSPVATRKMDRELDLAVLEPTLKSATWLNLSPDAAPHLGETVYALGYPYLGLLNQGLSVTGGNVSALGGIDVGEVRIMVSAPVQPGNSGGPLITSSGDVVGVVVSRIDDMNIFDQTGTLPQNMNFAVPPKALIDFLDNTGVAPVPSPHQDIDIARGLPDTMRDAVVPLFCY